MLVNCVAYQLGKKVADLRLSQVSEYLGQQDLFVWIALKDPESGELELLREELGLHELAVEDASHGRQRPKVEEYADCLFVTLQTLEINPQGDFDLGEVDIFVGTNYVLSVRHQTSLGFTSVRERCEKEPELLKHGPGFVLYALVDAIVDRYFPIEEYLEKELDRIEDSVFSGVTDIRSNIEEIYDLKHRLVTLQHAVSPLLEALLKLAGGRVPPVCQGLQEYYRDVIDHLSRISKSIEKRRDMAATAMQVTVSLIALNESEVSKKLASYAALFAVPTAIAGIYGMNFEHMPELQWKYGYPFVLFIIGVTDIILYRRFRKVGWL